jgi:hypothetical protein
MVAYRRAYFFIALFFLLITSIIWIFVLAMRPQLLAGSIFSPTSNTRMQAKYSPWLKSVNADAETSLCTYQDFFGKVQFRQTRFLDRNDRPRWNGVLTEFVSVTSDVPPWISWGLVATWLTFIAILVATLRRSNLNKAT